MNASALQITAVAKWIASGVGSVLPSLLFDNMADAFIEDLASRLSNRVQLSTDALRAYTDAVERAFGAEVDYGSIVKTFGQAEVEEQRRYSPSKITGVRRMPVQGQPHIDLISTSHVKKQNHTLRMHCRRLTRLTNAFSKKLKNFKAAVALHYAYYNFVKSNIAIRCTPAMAAGVTTPSGQFAISWK